MVSHVLDNSIHEFDIDLIDNFILDDRFVELLHQRNDGLNTIICSCTDTISDEDLVRIPRFLDIFDLGIGRDNLHIEFGLSRGMGTFWEFGGTLRFRSICEEGRLLQSLTIQLFFDFVKIFFQTLGAFFQSGQLCFQDRALLLPFFLVLLDPGINIGIVFFLTLKK